MSKAYQPLHHKYRPQRFDQLVGQEAIATTLGNALRSGRIAPAYLFCGPRGTGKTSSARILARSLNCIGSEGPTPEPCGVCELCTSITAGNALDVIEIDAASNTGVDNIRELIDRSRFAPVQARWKVYVVDECHMLSTAAFNALLKTLEEPPPRVMFVLATTDPQRVLPTILSRCQRFDFRRIPLQALERHLAWIAEQERIEITAEALLVVAQRAQGGLRDAESLLDQLSLLPAPIEATAVWDLLGAVPEQELLELARALGAAEPVAVLQTSRELLERGREPASVLQGLVSLLRDLVLAGVAPERLELTGVSPQLRGQLPELARSIGKARLLTWQAQLRSSEQQLRHSVNPRLWLEVLLLGLLAEAGSAGAATVPAAARQPSPQAPAAVPSVVPSTEDAPVPAVAAQSVAAQSVAAQAVAGPPVTGPPVAGQSTAGADGVGDGDGDGDGDGAEQAPSLGELWQRILAGLELPSTRMLLSQQARLVRLDERQAVVQVAGTWMTMVQTRQALVEQAIARTLGSARQLVLQAGLDTPNPAASGAPPAAALAVPAVPKAGPPARPAPPAPRATGTATQPHPIAQPQPAAPPSSAPPGATALDQQARRLAEFFNGEVIDFDGPLDDALPAEGDEQDGPAGTTSRAA